MTQNNETVTHSYKWVPDDSRDMHTGKITWVCLSCGNRYFLDDAEVVFTCKASTSKGSARFVARKVEQVLDSAMTVECPDCGFDMVMIDEPIIDAVFRFNEKGYITKYSCAGHIIKKDGVTMSDGTLPYITFYTKLNDDIFGWIKEAILATKNKQEYRHLYKYGDVTLVNPVPNYEFGWTIRCKFDTPMRHMSVICLKEWWGVIDEVSKAVPYAYHMPISCE